MNIGFLSTAIAAKIGTLSLLGVAACSCTSGRDLDYESYVKMPSKPSAVICRAALKSIPYTKERAFYGNYGGSGSVGGLPTDEMDEYFRRHDVVYRIAKSRRTMRVADEELVKALRRIDRESLSEEGREYRERAIKFMDSSPAEVIGKPLTAGLWKNEPKNSYFRDPESVRKFFQPSHPGIPNPAPGSMPLQTTKGGEVIGSSKEFQTLQHSTPVFP